MKRCFAGKVITLVTLSCAAFLVACAGSAPAVGQDEFAVEQTEPAVQSKPDVTANIPEEHREVASDVPAEALPGETVEKDSAGTPEASDVSDTVAAVPETVNMPEPVDAQEAVGALESPAVSDTVVTKVSFFAVGDVLFHTPLFNACKADENKCDFDPIFKNWKSDIESADFAAVNQETILVSREMGFSSYPAFGTPEQVGDAEIAAGFDIVTHATNHTIDRGAAAIDYTLNFWKSKGEASPIILGIHGSAEDKRAIRYAEKNGIKFAFFNNTYGLNGQKMPEDRQYLVDMQDENDEWLKPIAEADKNADVVVFFMHVGTEYVPIPSEDAQKKVRKAIDAGADIVVCHHPHVVEPFGVVSTPKGNTGLVYWSLGNFISNQKENPKLLGGVAKFVVQKTAVGENASFAVTEATFEGSVTHWDANGYTAIPLKDYTDSLAKRHAGKHASLKELQKLFTEAREGYSRCGTEKASERLPMPISPLGGVRE